VLDEAGLFGDTACVPEVFREEGYVVFFYANEGQEPIHVHVRRAGGHAKFWIEPLRLEYSEGLKVQELARAEQLIAARTDLIRRKWDEVFKR
jgi:hypothetical protein